MFTAEEVFQAYYDCRKHKRNTVAQRQFELRLERNLMRLCRELNDGTYQIGRSIVFAISYPKRREVWAAQFRDRVVHHLIYNRVADRFHRRFIHDSYACIPGRGSLMGADRVHGFMRQATQNWRLPAHFLQADIANFFVSIDKDILFDLLKERIEEGETLDLVRKVLFHDTTQNPLLNSPPWKLACVPGHKSLFHSKGKGLPIGNLSSQFFANVYLSPLDHFVKRDLGIRRYGRYVDDVVLVGGSPRDLNAAFAEMEGFVSSRLGIAFHPHKTNRNTVATGINFCGYILKPHRRYVRRRNTNAMRQVANSKERHSDPVAWAARLNSYLGLCRHANTYRLRKKTARESGAAFGPRFEKVIIRRACDRNLNSTLRVAQ